MRLLQKYSLGSHGLTPHLNELEANDSKHQEEGDEKTLSICPSSITKDALEELL
jgi:hypothetical protein